MKKLFLKIILSLLILFLTFGILLEIFIKERDKTICLKEDYKKIEYGENYNPKIEDLIDLEKFKFLDKIVFEIKRIIFLFVFVFILLAFSLLIYWVLLNMNFVFPPFMESFFTNLIACFTQFYKHFSFYKMIVDIQQRKQKHSYTSE